jgi:pimeloyl-ACP methyl ester carboxylesterase
LIFRDINGIETFARIDGKGEPIIFVHGLGLNHAIWEHQIALLSHSYETLVYDLRGHGRSGVPETGYSYAQYASDLKVLIEDCVRPPVHLVGLSMGGAIAFQFAGKHADDVRSITLVSPHICGYTSYENWPNMYKVARNHGIDAARQTWKDFRLFSGVRSDAEQWKKLSAMIDGFSCAPWIDPNPRYNDENDFEHAGKVAAPVLLAVGNEDQDFLPVAEHLRANLPDARLEMFECGHLVNYELPAEFNEALTAFLREV